MDNLVSIITPCYNGEKYLIPYLQSILNQTYDDIELIFVNDGSTDNSNKIIDSYKKKFEERGYKLSCFFQKNQGQAAAINTGLAMVNGEFTMWLDCDDLLHPDNIKYKVMFLKENKDYGFVMCNGESFYDDDFKNRKFDLNAVEKFNQQTFFEDLLFGRNHVIPGLYMVRTIDLFKTIHNMKIYTSRIGQNMQLLLPMSYSLKCGTIDKILFYYRIHNESHFRRTRTDFDWIKRLESYLDCCVNTILKIKMSEQYRLDIISRFNLYIKKRKFLIIYRASNNELGLMNISKKIIIDYLNIEEVRKNLNDRELIVWGATEFGVFIASKLRLLGLKVECFFDREYENIKRLSGYKVISPKEIDKEKYYIIIPLLYHKDIILKLKNASYTSIKDYYYPYYEKEG